MLADVFYGKHILTEPGRDLDANGWRMICVRRQWRRAVERPAPVDSRTFRR